MEHNSDHFTTSPGKNSSSVYKKNWNGHVRPISAGLCIKLAWPLRPFIEALGNFRKTSICEKVFPYIPACTIPEGMTSGYIIIGRVLFVRYINVRDLCSLGSMHFPAEVLIKRHVTIRRQEVVTEYMPVIMARVWVWDEIWINKFVYWVTFHQDTCSDIPR